MTSEGPKKISVRYYALLREQRGLNEEVISTSASTLGMLYEELKEKHPFTLNMNILKVARNDSFASWNDPLNNDDRVVFIPPVAGG